MEVTEEKDKLGEKEVKMEVDLEHNNKKETN